MKMSSAIAFVFAAALLTGAAFGDLPEKKQKVPGRSLEQGRRDDQSHDTHELEKLSFTVTGIMTGTVKGGPVTMTFLKVATSPDGDGDGKPDDTYLKVACSGSSVTEASLWSWGASNSGGRAGAAPPMGPGEWTSPSAKVESLSEGYLHKKLDKSLARRGAAGWVPVTLSRTDGLCP